MRCGGLRGCTLRLSARGCGLATGVTFADCRRCLQGTMAVRSSVRWWSTTVVATDSGNQTKVVIQDIEDTVSCFDPNEPAVVSDREEKEEELCWDCHSKVKKTSMFCASCRAIQPPVGTQNAFEIFSL